MRTTIKLVGFKEMEQALLKIEKASTAKALMLRALTKAAQPMADLAEANAPVDEGHLKRTVAVSKALSRNQKKLHRKLFKNDKAAVEVFVGPAPRPSAHLQEFGTAHHAAQPFMRPAFDAEARPTLDRLGRQMWAEIDKQAKRAANKAARLAAKGG